MMRASQMVLSSSWQITYGKLYHKLIFHARCQQRVQEASERMLVLHVLHISPENTLQDYSHLVLCATTSDLFIASPSPSKKIATSINPGRRQSPATSSWYSPFEQSQTMLWTEHLSTITVTRVHPQPNDPPAFQHGHPFPKPIHSFCSPIAPDGTICNLSTHKETPATVLHWTGCMKPRWWQWPWPNCCPIKCPEPLPPGSDWLMTFLTSIITTVLGGWEVVGVS